MRISKDYCLEYRKFYIVIIIAKPKFYSIVILLKYNIYIERYSSGFNLLKFQKLNNSV